MSTFLESMAYPFLACLTLTGIHVYLGIHVIQRKVIFVDLALATIAALGAVWGAFLGWDIHKDVWVIRGFSLAFTFVGAAVFSLSRMRHDRVPHEAIIGITYAVALAAIILGAAKLPHGAEEVRDLQAGSILWISGGTVLSTAVLYAVIGAFHYAFRDRFFAISRGADEAEASGINVRFWDFLFYVSFGFVVTSSVSIAGVLLVFSYLVIPAVVATLFAERVRARLAIGWIVGTVVSAIGVVISYRGDLPSGPVIVVCFGVFLVAAALVYYVLHHPSRRRALLQSGGGVVAVGLLVQGSLLLEKPHDLDVVHILETGTKRERIMALAEVAEDPELWPEVTPVARRLLADAAIEVRLSLLELVADAGRLELLPEIHALLNDVDDVVREEAVQCIRHLSRPESADALAAAAQSEEDEYIRVELAEALLELGDKRGVPILLDVMDRGEAEQARRDAFEHLRAHVDCQLPYHSQHGLEGHTEEIEAYRRWWEENRDEPGVIH